MNDPNDDKYGSDVVGGWQAVGIPPVEAESWSRAGYGLNEARDWRSAGALEPGTAADWERHGFTPSTAQPWIVIGEIGPADAITMSEAGMTPTRCARIRAFDPFCLNGVTDPSAPPRIEDQPAAIGF